MDTIKQFAEALRSKGGIENRSGVLQGERFELFRGKDLVRWVKANPEKCAAAGGGGWGPPPPPLLPLPAHAAGCSLPLGPCA